ncbi:MAG: hypothetical protein KGI00_03550 [Candidatus Micrarchaeota archaeon]|nr:hypothetical protein [Candidatus Micrarchaeota archaeon]MDE1849778.1 hypothetical protein [Candidatus Micrarchaeota archaeon]
MCIKQEGIHDGGKGLRLDQMIKYAISKGARILFVGINPHHGSYRRGVPFSNNKTFWYLLNRAGVINERIDELKTDEGLKDMYETRFTRLYSLNFTNIITRPSHDVSELRKGEEDRGRIRILKTIIGNRPRVVCFIGKVTYSKFLNSNSIRFGWQNDIGRSRVYLMHFPIRGAARIRVNELRRIKEVAFNGKG